MCNKHLKVFNTSLGPSPAKVPPMELEVDQALWEVRANQGPPRHQTLEKQREIQKQVEKMLENEVISRSTADHYSQVHLTPKPIATKSDKADPGTSQMSLDSDDDDDDSSSDADDILKETSSTNISSKSSHGWRFCIDFRNLNVVSKGMGWPIPNIRHMLQRIGDKKPRILGKFDLTSGYFQAPLAVDSRVFTAFTTHMGLYHWNRVAMGLKIAGPWFQQVLA